MQCRSTGGVYTVSGDLTITRAMASHKDLNMKISMIFDGIVKSVLGLLLPTTPTRKVMNIGCGLAHCNIHRANCGSMATVLKIPSSTICDPNGNMKTGTHNFVQTKTIRNVTRLLTRLLRGVTRLLGGVLGGVLGGALSGVTDALQIAGPSKLIMNTEFYDPNTNEQVGCLREEIPGH